MFTTAAIDAHTGGWNLRTMTRTALALVALLGLTGCEVNWAFDTTFETKGPAATHFELAGRPYDWRIASGKKATGLFLSRVDGAGNGKIIFTVSCSSPDEGGLLVRFGNLDAESLTLEADSQAFTVPARREEKNGHIALKGDGAIADGWFDALGRARQVVIAHGDDRWAFTGPGKDLARRFERFCEENGRNNA